MKNNDPIEFEMAPLEIKIGVFIIIMIILIFIVVIKNPWTRKGIPKMQNPLPPAPAKPYPEKPTPRDNADKMRAAKLWMAQFERRLAIYKSFKDAAPRMDGIGIDTLRDLERSLNEELGIYISYTRALEKSVYDYKGIPDRIVIESSTVEP